MCFYTDTKTSLVKLEYECSTVTQPHLVSLKRLDEFVSQCYFPTPIYLVPISCWGSASGPDKGVGSLWAPGLRGIILMEVKKSSLQQ